MKALSISVVVLVGAMMFVLPAHADERWHFDDTGVQGWGQTYDPPRCETAGGSLGPGRWQDFDHVDFFYAVTPALNDDFSGQRFSVEFWAANNYEGHSNRVDFYLSVGGCGSPGPTLASDTVYVTNATPAQKYVADFGIIDSLNLAGESLVVTIEYSGQEYDAHIYWDSTEHPSALLAEVDGGGGPVVQWLDRFSDGATSVPKDLVTDSAGNVIVTGSVDEGTGGSDFLTIKYGSAGNVEWSRRWSGSTANQSDVAYAVAVDSHDDVYVTGSSWQGSGDTDITTVKYDGTNGAEIWTKIWGSGTDDYGADLVAADGRVFVIGRRSYRLCLLALDDSDGTFDWYYHHADGSAGVAVTFAGGDVWFGGNENSDYRLFRYRSDGLFYWTQTWDDGGIDSVTAIESDGNYVYVTGKSRPGVGTHDIVTVCYSASGSYQWMTEFGGIHDDVPTAMTMDADSNLYITGETDGDYVTLSLNPLGSVRWSQVYPGPHTSLRDDTATGIALDTEAPPNVYVTGKSRDTDGDWDYATIKYDSAGVQQWIERYSQDGSSDDEAVGIAIFDQQSIYVTGESEGEFLTIKYNDGFVNHIEDCQGIDAPDSNVLYVNGSQGGATHTVQIAGTAPITFSIVKPPAGGNGKFFAHLNAGKPTPATITVLPAQLGSMCHPALIPPAGTADPLANWNCIGKVTKVGSSQYFGPAIPNPSRAPAFFLNDPDGDPAHFPVGAEFTLQAVILNPTATSPKTVSVTNAIAIEVTN